MAIIINVILFFMIYGSYILGPIFGIMLIVTIFKKKKGEDATYEMVQTAILGLFFVLAVISNVAMYGMLGSM